MTSRERSLAIRVPLDGSRGGAGSPPLLGPAGDDVISAVAGDDCIDGGPGDDRLSGVGGAGADVIRARYGSRDRTTCAAGADRIIADASDRVAGDCERVTPRRS